MSPSVACVLNVNNESPEILSSLTSTLPIAPPEATFACLTLVLPAKIDPKTSAVIPKDTFAAGCALTVAEVIVKKAVVVPEVVLADPGKVITSVAAAPFSSVPTIVTVIVDSFPRVVAVIFLAVLVPKEVFAKVKVVVGRAAAATYVLEEAFESIKVCDFTSPIDLFISPYFVAPEGATN
jgi:hypothetical protein